MLDSGKLRHRIEIYAQTDTQNSTTGESAASFPTLAATRWGSIEPLKGKEYEWANETRPAVTHMVKMRYYTGLTTKHRLKFGTRVFNIEEIIVPREIKHEMQILVHEEPGAS